MHYENLPDVNFFRKYPLTLLLTAIVIYLSLFNPADVGLEDVKIQDKWAHTVMYLGYELVLWFEFWKNRERAPFFRTVLPQALAVIAFSGLMELIQEYCTVVRSGDWLDFAANSIGVTLGTVLGLTAVKAVRKRITLRSQARKNKDGE